ncbi:hypothetical protein [Streptomyces sp. NPDC049585]|uniref:hypothetical protein n=1 Tax=Streptomyces sp. NPDC049585 TaxID=3155154 RepID=UPI003426DB61
MSRLIRAPRECGSWWWEFDDVAIPGLEATLATAARMVEVLENHGLLKAQKLEYGWYVEGVGGIGLTTTLPLTVPLGDPALAERIRQSRPVGFPEAQVADIRVLGVGTWIDAQGRERREQGLVDLEMTPDPDSIAAELTVHHDIWKLFDFSGRPHPELQQRNAPRLAAALQELDAVLGEAATPGEATYFGVAEGYGIATPDLSSDGLGPDLTDKL